MNKLYYMLEVVQSSVKNEDFVLAGERTFGVLDGATPVGGSHSILTRFLKNVMRDILHNENKPLIESVGRAAFNYSWYDEEWESEPPSAAVGIVRVFDDKVEIVRVSDVFIGVLGEKTHIFRGAKISSLDARAWEMTIDKMKKGKSYEEEIKWAFETVLLENRKKLGREYDALYPGADVGEFQRTILDRRGIEKIVIASDGAFRAVEAGLCSAEDFLQENPLTCVRRLRTWEENVNPVKSPIPLFSRHDDATFLRITFE